MATTPPPTASAGAAVATSAGGTSACGSSSVADSIRDTLKTQGGVLFAKQCIVHRVTYSGRDIIAPNSAFSADKVDERGYVPVERWILSKTVACNPVNKAGEGISQLIVGDSCVGFPDCLAAVPDLLGSFAEAWPLTKVLDIGGTPIPPRFGDKKGAKEVPGIPCHVHAGDVGDDGHCKLHTGKLEAYFFPPLHVAPYKADLGKVITRLGLRPSATPAEAVKALKRFGKDDSMYALLNEYPVQAYQSWTIQPGVVHAPGPWTTFEIQRPQDDCNLLAWQLGKQLHGEEYTRLRASEHLGGLPDEAAVLKETIDWDRNVDKDFGERWRYDTTAKPIASGSWGRHLRIFFDQFYGEAIEVAPGSSFTREASDKPWGGIVWSGAGSLNGCPLSATVDGQSEFLVTPGASATFTCSGKEVTGSAADEATADGTGAADGAGGGAGATSVATASDSGARLLVYVVFPIDESVKV